MLSELTIDPGRKELERGMRESGVEMRELRKRESGREGRVMEREKERGRERERFHLWLSSSENIHPSLLHHGKELSNVLKVEGRNKTDR